jgi:hypothetical protein
MAMKKVGSKATPKPDGDQGKPAPARGAKRRTNGDAEGGNGGGQSKADVFDKTKAQGAIDAGKYEAIITELVLQDEDEKGQSVRMKYEIATDGDFRGQSLAQFYKLFEANGGAGKGAAFLKKDLAVLGYPDVSFEDLESVFEEIVEKELGVVITVKINGQFTNAYLGGLCEDSDIIDEYKANKPPY